MQQVDRQQEEGGTNHAQDDHAGDQGAGHWVHWLGAGRRCWKMEVWKQTLERTQLFIRASFYMSSLPSFFWSSLLMCSVIQPITINYGCDNSYAHLPRWELLTGFSSERIIWQRFVNIFLILRMHWITILLLKLHICLICSTGWKNKAAYSIKSTQKGQNEGKKISFIWTSIGN